MRYSIAFSILTLSVVLATAQQKPNIIHILADDVGYDDIGCFGSTDISTPNLDSMASDGMLFTDFYAPHGTCTPSRAAILTGRYAPRVNNGTGLPVLFPDSDIGLDTDLEITITELLKEQGYETALVGKWHLGHLPEYLPGEHGFDYFLGIPYPNDHGPERLANTGSREFPPIPLIENYDVIDELDNIELAELPALFTRIACDYIREMAGRDQRFYLQYANIETHTPWFVPKGFDGFSKAGPYGDAVEYLDRSVGAILRTLKEMDIEENTLIVFSSDNGPLIVPYPELEACYGHYARVDTSRTHKLRGGKYQSRYEGGTRVACIMRWPGTIPPGTTCDHIAAGFDLFTTFALLAGADIPSDRPIDGKDLYAVMTMQEGVTSPHQEFSGYEARGLQMSYREGPWKISLPSKATYGAGALDHYELFNLESDPGERQDVSSEYPFILEQMTDKAKAFDKSVKQ
ncbi:MAG: sulfatase [Bacteroidales bacterium]|jgi:arylsulfatase A-like enzyme|nr:sulfatase [Bacteroidales bacterium]